jgi:hypothetical protein
VKREKQILKLMSLRVLSKPDTGEVIVNAYGTVPGKMWDCEAALSAKEARQLAAMLLFQAEEVSA